MLFDVACGCVQLASKFSNYCVQLGKPCKHWDMVMTSLITNENGSATVSTLQLEAGVYLTL